MIMFASYQGSNAQVIAQDDRPVEYPIDGTLDLHLFAPEDTKEVVEEYIRVCLQKKILGLRIVHGKGIGVKREIVHGVLKNHPNVLSYRHEGDPAGHGGQPL